MVFDKHHYVFFSISKYHFCARSNNNISKLPPRRSQAGGETGMTPKELAEAHWNFQERWLHMIFVDAFLHGYKHALEAKPEGSK